MIAEKERRSGRFSHICWPDSLVLRRHDNIDKKCIDFGGVRLHTLGYADDAALIDMNPTIASARVTSIAQGSKRDADMKINIVKTECVHVKRQQSVDTPD